MNGQAIGSNVNVKIPKPNAPTQDGTFAQTPEGQAAARGLADTISMGTAD